mmetsp:Transcript_8964/g.31638  ORF Transcript_8964/g.31638 Transcript_8964/m.31638 type:complete len:220 (-) Transcript_8964:1032-1691(-)
MACGACTATFHSSRHAAIWMDSSAGNARMLAVISGPRSSLEKISTSIDSSLSESAARRASACSYGSTAPSPSRSQNCRCCSAASDSRCMSALSGNCAITSTTTGARPTLRAMRALAITSPSLCRSTACLARARLRSSRSRTAPMMASNAATPSLVCESAVVRKLTIISSSLFCASVALIIFDCAAISSSCSFCRIALSAVSCATCSCRRVMCAVFWRSL